MEQYYEEDNDNRLQDFYPSMNNTSEDGQRLTEADGEKEDQNLLGKKRKLTDPQNNDSSQNDTKFEKNENIVVSEAQKEAKTEEDNESNVEGPHHQNDLTLKNPNPIMNSGCSQNGVEKSHSSLEPVNEAHAEIQQYSVILYRSQPQHIRANQSEESDSFIIDQLRGEEGAEGPEESEESEESDDEVLSDESTQASTYFSD